MKLSDFGVIEDEATRKKYSVDASIFEVMPRGVVQPDSLDWLQHIIRGAIDSTRNGEYTTVAARSGGTCMSGGSLTEGIVIDMTKGFSWVGEIDKATNTVWVGGGTYFRDIEKSLTEQGYLFASYPNSRKICGIGGMIGNNASGELSVRHGATSENVEAVKVVLADGNEYEFGPLNTEQLEAKCAQEDLEGHIYRSVRALIEAGWDEIWKKRPKVRKNAAGYALYRVWDRDKTTFNLAQLFIGAQGTLGVMTAAKLKVLELYADERMLVTEISSLSKLPEALKIITSHRPAGVEMYDKYTYNLAKEYLPEHAKAAAEVADGKEMVLFAWFSEPTKDATDHAESVCQRALKRAGYDCHTVKDEAERMAHIEIRRDSFQLLKDYAKGSQRAVPFVEDIIVNIEHFGEFIGALEAILSDYDMVYTYAGHIGDGSIRLIPLVDMEADDAVEKVFELAQRVYDLVFAFGGSMSVDHNDGIMRTPYIERMFGPQMVEMFESVKNIFDPFNVFNSGKKVHGTLEYAKAHMSRSNGNPNL